MSRMYTVFSIAAIIITGTIFSSSEIFAITYPSGAPAGETIGGTYRTYFDNMFPGCSTAGYVIRGFNADGTPICISPTAASFTISGSVLGSTLYYNGTDWVASTNIYNTGGNVGIGTTTPGAKLEVSADALIHGLTIGQGTGDLPENTAFGVSALFSNTTGDANTAIGYSALFSNTTGVGNTAIGDSVLYSNTVGDSNTAIGGFALYSNTAGAGNTAMGSSALYANTTGIRNTAMGNYALNLNTTGNYNTTSGYQSLFSNISGYYNTANGDSALYANTTGYYNTAIGGAVLMSNSTGYQNTANGYSSLLLNTTGYSNTANGYRALYSNTSGNLNAGYGYQALQGNTTGNSNVGIGNMAGQNLTSGNYNIFIGYNTQPNISNTGSNQLNIGNWIYGNSGSIGIGVLNPSAKLDIAGTIKIVDGTQGAGKVLISDASGLASWGTPSSTAQICPGSGANNTCYGSGALSANTTGYSNTANGVSALQTNTTGYSNTAIGYRTLYLNTSGYQNTAIGYGVLYSNTTGYSNTANGMNALYSNTSGNGNVANGVGVLYSNTTGYSNTANGNNALYNNISGYQNTANGISTLTANTTGYYNTANGAYALTANTSGTYNTANGLRSLSNNTTGNYNTADGSYALSNNTTGWYNVALGSDSLFSNSGGSNHIGIGYQAMRYIVAAGGTSPNTAIGYQALYGGTGTAASNTAYDNVAIGYQALMGNNAALDPSTGYSNVAIGNGALYANTSGYYNTANGNRALSSNTSGSDNTANGYRSLYSNTSGNQNTAHGNYSLYSNSTGSSNVANGYRSLYSNTTGYYNTANGNYSLYSNTTGIQNTANGYRALYSNTTGNDNVANGTQTLSANTTGYNNTANGNYSLYFNTTGTGNVANGYYSLYYNTTGYGNTANGNNALIKNTTGINNTANGYAAGYNISVNLTGSNNTFLGYNTTYTNGSIINATAIGANAYVNANNTMVLGSINGVNGATADTTVVIGSGASSSGVYRLDVQRGYVNSSSGLCINGACVNSWSGLNNIVKSSGTPNYIAKFNSGGLIDNSQIYETGGKLYIGDIPSIIGGSATIGYVTIESPSSTNSSNPFLTLSENGGQECRMWINGANKLGSNCTWTAGMGGNYSPNQLIRADSAGTDLTGATIYQVGNNFGFGTSTGTSLFEVWSGAVSYMHMRGTNNLGIGAGSVRPALTGNANIGFGHETLYTLTTGYSNSAFGHQALRMGTTVFNNSAFGKEAMYNASDATWNTAMGYQALRSGTSEDYNVAIGGQALYNLGTGQGNVAIGHNALYGATTTAANNVAIGYMAGSGITTGSNNIMIGNSVQSTNGTLSDQLNIGNWIYGNGGNIGVGTGSSLTSKFTIDSGVANVSGLRFSRVNASSTVVSNNVIGLGVNGSGEVVPVSNGDVIVYDGLSTTTPSPDPDNSNREISYNFNKYFTIPAKQSFVVTDGLSPGTNAPYIGENAASSICEWDGTYGTGMATCPTGDSPGSPYNSFTMSARSDAGYGYQIGLAYRGDVPLMARSGRFRDGPDPGTAVDSDDYGRGLYVGSSNVPAPWYKVFTVPTNHIEWFYIDTGYTGQFNATGKAGMIGVGTTDPNYQVDIRGTVGISGQLTVSGAVTTAAAPAFSFMGDTDLGIFRPAADTLSVSTAGSERMRIFSNGNVSIGSTTNSDKLRVDGTVKLGTNGTQLNAIIRATVSKDVPSIAASACSAQTFTVTNATTTGTAFISPASALTDRMIITYARVSAAGTVEAKFCNESAAAIDLASMNYYITVMQ